MPSDTPADLRAANARIAAGYDIMPFDPRIDPSLDPDRVLGVAALYGGSAEGDLDILDLGCGTGTQLERVGSLTHGRLVGVDLSGSACARARSRCAGFGERCRIIEGDLSDLDAAVLGQFDLIYHVGVLYVMPPAVHARMLALIATCLKPGGVAVISYFAGLGPMVMAGLNQMLRAADKPDTAPNQRLSVARARIGELLQLYEGQPAENRIVLQVLRYAQTCDDAILFHEMLNQPLSTLATASLEAALAPHRVHFLNWMAPGPFGEEPAAMQRARVADAGDLAGGGYHSGIFAKCPESGPDLRRARWTTRLKRTAAGPGPGIYRDDVLRRSVNVTNPATAAALDVAANGPAAWSAFPAGDETGRLRDFLGLWQMGLIAPLR